LVNAVENSKCHDTWRWQSVGKILLHLRLRKINVLDLI
jgi:hypothetical protein